MVHWSRDQTKPEEQTSLAVCSIKFQCYSVHHALSQPQKHACRQGETQYILWTDDLEKIDSYNTGLWNCLHKQGFTVGILIFFFSLGCCESLLVRLQEGVCFREGNVKDKRETAWFPGLESIFWKIWALQLTSCEYNYYIFILQTDGALLSWLCCQSAVLKEITFKAFMQTSFCLFYWGFCLFVCCFFFGALHQYTAHKRSCCGLADSVGQSWKSHALQPISLGKCGLQVGSR